MIQKCKSVDTMFAFDDFYNRIEPGMIFNATEGLFPQLNEENMQFTDMCKNRPVIVIFNPGKGYRITVMPLSSQVDDRADFVIERDSGVKVRVCHQLIDTDIRKLKLDSLSSSFGCFMQVNDKEWLHELQKWAAETIVGYTPRTMVAKVPDGEVGYRPNSTEEMPEDAKNVQELLFRIRNLTERNDAQAETVMKYIGEIHRLQDILKEKEAYIKELEAKIPRTPLQELIELGPDEYKRVHGLKTNRALSNILQKGLAEGKINQKEANEILYGEEYSL